MNRIIASIILTAAAFVLQTPVAWAVVLPNPTITAAADPFSPSFVASNVFDSRRNEFATSGNGAGTSLSTDSNDGTWINFDFGAAVSIDRFVTVSRQNNVDVVGVSRLIFSNDATFDGSDPVVTINATGLNGAGPIHSFPAQTAQYVRWEVVTSDASSQNLGSQEMRFLSTPANTAILTPLVINSAPAFNATTYAATNAANNDAGRDGPNPREYASQSQGANMFIDFDLGISQRVIGFDFFDRLSESEDVSGFDLIFSDDPGFGTIIATKSYPHPMGDGYTTTDLFATPVTARYVRLDATNIDGIGLNTGVAEMIFYAQVVPEPASLTTAGLAIAALAAVRIGARRRRVRWGFCRVTLGVPRAPTMLRIFFAIARVGTCKKSPHHETIFLVF